MSDQPPFKHPPEDGTRDGAGTWRGGMWHPDDPAMWRTHHEAASAEERYSRTMRFDKYYAMQQLLMEIANHEGLLNVTGIDYKARAEEILAGMVRPRGPAVRAKDRATELDMLALAYRVASGVFPVESPHLAEARTLMVEALKAWERAHPPAPIDPLLGP